MPSTGCARRGKYRGSTISPDGGPECCMLAAAHQKGAVLYGIDGRAAACGAQGVSHVTAQVQYRSGRRGKNGSRGSSGRPLRDCPAPATKRFGKPIPRQIGQRRPRRLRRRADKSLICATRLQDSQPVILPRGVVAADPDSRTTESRTGGATLLGLPPRIGSTIVHHRGL